MSIPDDLMWSYSNCSPIFSQQEIAALKNAVKSGQVHPKKAKEDLAKKIVDEFHTLRAEASATEILALSHWNEYRHRVQSHIS